MELQKKIEKPIGTQIIRTFVSVNGKKMPVESTDPKKLYAILKLATKAGQKKPSLPIQEQFDKFVEEYIRHSIPFAQDTLLGKGKRFYRKQFEERLQIARQRYAEKNVGHWRIEKVEEVNGKKLLNARIEWVWDSCTTKE